VSDLKKMRARAEYHRSIDLSHIDNIGLDQYAALIACAEALDSVVTLASHSAEVAELAFREARAAIAQLRAVP
jgi:hypothetical protein